MKGIWIALLALLPALAFHANTKPPCALGFCMGHSIDAEPDGNAVGVFYRVVEHAAFNGGVEVHWTRATGVCEVRGYQTIAPRHRTDIGAAHKREFDRLTELVTRNHGEPDDEFDLLRLNSVWKEQRHWLKALQSGERTLANFWVEGLREGVTSIAVEAKFDGVEVRYQFANVVECRQEGRRLFAGDF